MAYYLCSTVYKQFCLNEILSQMRRINELTKIQNTQEKIL